MFRACSDGSGVTWKNTKNAGLVNHLAQFIVGTPLVPDVMAIGLQDNGSRLRQGNTSIFNQARRMKMCCLDHHIIADIFAARRR